jgi:hypothetical protein
MKLDICPLLGDIGVWSLTNYLTKQKVKGNDEKKKMTQTAIDIVLNYLEHGFDQLGKESKYNLLNRFGPKKCPEKTLKREEIPIIYSWSHYASKEWFNFLV